MSRKEKSYSDHVRELSGDAIYEGLVGYGLFSEKLPPIFTAEAFLKYCKANPDKLYPLDRDRKSQFVPYESHRNNNDFRQIGIPNPFAHELLARFVKMHWPLIQQHLLANTHGQDHKISRIHLRRMWGTPTLFKMNYKSKCERVRSPTITFLKGARFCVKADISNCFPSIYSHSLAWAIVGKDEAKRHINDSSQWYNQLDKYTRNMKDGETNGLLIGPHVSNLLSELILVVVDKNLYNAGFRFVRHIDDYDCYVETHERADEFIMKLADELRQFALVLNRKKTKIFELPLEQEEGWVRSINCRRMLMPKDRWGFDAVRVFLGEVVALLKDYSDLAVLCYAMKIASNMDMTESARHYYVKYMLHLAMLYPYLYQYLDEFLFEACDVPFSEIKDFAVKMFDHGVKCLNREEVVYALYFAVKYRFAISNFTPEKVIGQNSAILDLMTFLYLRANGLKATELGELARTYGDGQHDSDGTLDQFWPFVYEVNKSANIKNEYFRNLKSAGVSFVKDLSDIQVQYDPEMECRFPDWGRNCATGASKILVDKLLGQFRKDMRLRRLAEMHSVVMSSLLANFYHGVLLRYNLSIPRSLAYFDSSPVVSFNGLEIDGQIARSIIDWLRRKQYIGEKIGAVGEGASSYWAKSKLLSEFKAISAREIEYAAKNANVFVVLKNRKKEILWDAPHNEKSKQYQQNLSIINGLLKKHLFECETPLCGKRQPFAPVLRAIFNNASWDEGGRLYAVLTEYGVNYQDIPSNLRKSMTIDREQTVELDYAALHIAMLYALNSLEVHGDVYDIRDVPRALVKKVLLVIINADDKTAALKSLEKDAEELSRRTILSPKKRELRQGYEVFPDLEKALGLIEEKHHAISNYFYTGHGIKLQSTDSAMALDILLQFAKDGIPVLPVHDSFIIQKKHEDKLRLVMESTFRKYNGGYSCVVK